MSLTMDAEVHSHAHEAPPTRAGDGGKTSDLQEALRLATQLCERLESSLDADPAQRFRTRLVLAHALSVVDLLTDLAAARVRDC